MIIGIDPGLNKTGWAVLSSEKDACLIDCGLITTKSSDRIELRLLCIHHNIISVLKKYQIKDACIEKIFVNKNPLSTLLLGCARGVALMSVSMLGAKVHEYSPNTIKKFITGYGHATKDQMIRMIGTLIPSDFDINSDIADAISLALYHQHFHHRSMMINK